MSNSLFNSEKYPTGNWIFSEKPKVTYIDPKDASPINKVIMYGMKIAAHTPETINVFKVLAHLKGILLPYTAFFASIYKTGKINNKEKEKIIVRTAWRLGCIYEYSQHRPFLSKAGESKAQIDSYAEEYCDSWDDRTRTIFNAIDDIVDNHIVSDEHFEKLKKYYSDDQIVEFLMLVGHYIMIAVTINSSGVQLEDYSWLK